MGQVSTLSEVVRGPGSRLRIVAELPERPPVYLTGFGDIAVPTGKRAPVRRRAGEASAKARAKGIST